MEIYPVNVSRFVDVHSVPADWEMGHAAFEMMEMEDGAMLCNLNKLVRHPS